MEARVLLFTRVGVPVGMIGSHRTGVAISSLRQNTEVWGKRRGGLRDWNWGRSKDLGSW